MQNKPLVVRGNCSTCKRPLCLSAVIARLSLYNFLFTQKRFYLLEFLILVWNLIKLYSMLLGVGSFQLVVLLLGRELRLSSKFINRLVVLFTLTFNQALNISCLVVYPEVIPEQIHLPGSISIWERNLNPIRHSVFLQQLGYNPLERGNRMAITMCVTPISVVGVIAILGRRVNGKLR